MNKNNHGRKENSPTVKNTTSVTGKCKPVELPEGRFEGPAMLRMIKEDGKQKQGENTMKKIHLMCLALILCMTVCAAYAESTERYAAAVAPAVDTTSEYELLQDIMNQIRERTDFVPHVAIILGSGLNGLAEKTDTSAVIPYSDIRGLPVSTAPGHVGQFVFGYLEGVPVVIMQGRVHCYEGYTALQVVRPVRVMKMLGAETLILTNSSGGINTDFQAGEIMLITDQILFGVQNPLTGANLEALGERFTDMKDAYDPELRELLRQSAAEIGISLREGVYLQDPGPNYETPAETAMFRTLGADAVGMSTGIEAVAARHMGMRVCGLSCVTAAPSDISSELLSDEVVNARADAMTEDLGRLLSIFIGKLNTEAE